MISPHVSNVTGTSAALFDHLLPACATLKRCFSFVFVGFVAKISRSDSPLGPSPLRTCRDSKFAETAQWLSSFAWARWHAPARQTCLAQDYTPAPSVVQHCRLAESDCPRATGSGRAPPRQRLGLVRGAKDNKHDVVHHSKIARPMTVVGQARHSVTFSAGPVFSRSRRGQRPPKFCIGKESLGMSAIRSSSAEAGFARNFARCQQATNDSAAKNRKAASRRRA